MKKHCCWTELAISGLYKLKLFYLKYLLPGVYFVD